MLFLLDMNGGYDEAAGELGVKPADVGQLITPLTRFKNHGRQHFGIDNGAFSRFDPKAFRSLLKREEPNRSKCRFVVAEVFERWKHQLAGWPIALACQDGQEDLPIPMEDEPPRSCDCEGGAGTR